MTKLVIDEKKFPNLHMMWKDKPEDLEEFLCDMAQRLWAGNLEEAMKTIEEYFEEEVE